MSYQETIDYLYTKLPMFSRIGAAAIKPNLDNTIAICKLLGNPEQKVKTIHIAGTNGKGSTSHMLASIFQEAGYKTGLYTSPHLYDFRERIKVNGEMCSKEFVIEFTNRIKPFIEQVAPSFFEITVGMAFDYFEKEKVDIAIIETGLGGRLDSTNVITPELSIITNIGFDHMALLGNTIEAIASEKAGIIKKETPVIIGESSPASKNVFEEKAKNENAPLYFAEDLLQLKSFQNNWSTALFEFTQPLIHLLDAPLFAKNFTIESDLPGKYQAKNLKSVLAATQLLSTMGWKLTATKVTKALLNIQKNTGLMGRWECIQTNPKVILDVAHNEHGIQALLEQLVSLHYNKLHIVTGMVKDKDIQAVLSLLPNNAQYYFTQSHIPRALPVNELVAQATELGLNGLTYMDVNIALDEAIKNANHNDLILVIGSIFLVAEVDRTKFK
jgi:dihydrofolate synthase / folylpolyglutamate synthase